MTVKHRLRAEQLQVGAPLPVDVYDAENRLLLRRGNVIATESQLERLIASGLFTNQLLPTQGGAPEPSKPKSSAEDPFVDGPLLRASVKPLSKAPRRISVYSEILQAAQKLDALLRAAQSSSTFAADVDSLADTICLGCSLDADAALAHIMFSTEARYPVRQSINVAIVTALLLERTKNDPARTKSAVSAALTMNLSIGDVLDHLYQQQSMSPEQQTALNVHPVASARQLEALGVTDRLWLTLVEQHHEFIDGSGYPNKLTAAAIALEAQVIGLADRYCSAVTERAYRPGVAPGMALKQLREKSGAAIDASLIGGLVYWVGIYPPGTVVELFNRDVAVVTRRLQDLKNPMVYAVAGDNHQPFDEPRRRATGTQPQFHIERVLPRDTIKFKVDPEVLWPRTVLEEAPA